MELLFLKLKKELRNLDSLKTDQESDISTKIIKDNTDIFISIH